VLIGSSLHQFYAPWRYHARPWNRDGVVCPRFTWPLLRPEVFMAIQDYVRSIAATETVSKDQVFRFLEMQFARADRNHDGQLDADELAAFVHAVAKPEADQR
jgi:hypothetical protein